MVFQKLGQAIRGLFRRDGTNPPAICYSVCNDVVRAVQVSGKTPEICEVNSTFMLSAGDCQACIGRNSNQTYEDTILPLFKETLDYCEDTTTNENKTANIEALLSQESSLQTQLASLGYSPSSTRPANSLSATTTDSGNQVTVYRTAPVQSTGDSSGTDSNISTIVPAVVVPVVVVGIVVVLGFFFVRRRNQQKRLAPIQSSLPPIEKAQLHADEFRPELDGTNADQSRSELDGTEGTRGGMRTLGLPPLELPVQKDVRREDVTGELEAKK